MKKNKIIKLSLFFLLLLFFAGGANLVWAAKEYLRPPEIDYPPLPSFLDAERPNDFIKKINEEAPGYLPEQALPLYIKYFYTLFIITSGFIAFGAIAFGGLQYLVSLGNPGKTAEGRERITGGALGLLLLLSSYLILTTINPQLAIFQITKTEDPELLAPAAFPVPETGPITHYEIPVGKLIELGLYRNKPASEDKLREAEKIAEEINNGAEKIKKLANQLKDLTQECKCSLASPPPGCGFQDCSPQASCAGEPCENRKQIEAKQAELKKEIQGFKNNIDEKWTPKIQKLLPELGQGWVNLAVAKEMFNNCRYENLSESELKNLPPDYEIVRSRIWKDLDTKSDEATFYCTSENILAIGETAENQNIDELIKNLIKISPAAVAPPIGPPLVGVLGCPLANPNQYIITAGFRSKLYLQEYGNQLGPHNGIDINTGEGSLIYSPANGTVLISGNVAYCGVILVINHPEQNLQTKYCHLQRPAIGVRVGADISGGQTIAYADTSGAAFGPHLHFELKTNGNAVEPRDYIDCLKNMQCASGWCVYEWE